MKKQMTSIEMVMVLVLGAVLIGFVVLAVPFGSQPMGEGSLDNFFTDNNAGQDRAISTDTSDPVVGNLETRFIYSHEERAIPRPAGEDLEAFFSPKDAIDKTPSWIIESHKERWAAPANSAGEPSASAKAAVTDRYSSVTNDSGSPDYLNMRLLQEYKKEGLVPEANSGGESSAPTNEDVAVRYDSVIDDNGSPDYLNMHQIWQYDQAK